MKRWICLALIFSMMCYISACGKGYRLGEKIAIKANINESAVFDDDTSGETNMSYTNPVLLKNLLLSLVEEAGVSPKDITVYDVSRLFPDYMIKMCSEGDLRGVHFVGRDNGIADEDAPINWSYEFSGNINYLPTCVTEAEDSVIYVRCSYLCSVRRSIYHKREFYVEAGTLQWRLHIQYFCIAGPGCD